MLLEIDGLSSSCILWTPKLTVRQKKKKTVTANKTTNEIKWNHMYTKYLI